MKTVGNMRYINKRDLLIIFRNTGLLMIGIGGLCLVPIVVDLIYLEFNAISYIVPSLISIGLGLFCINILKKYDILPIMAVGGYCLRFDTLFHN